MRLLDEYGEALEADLRRQYQADIRDLWRGGMDWRQFRVLVLGMPPTGTALARAMHGTAAGDWTSTDELLRKLTTIAQDHHWGFFEANRDTKKQPRSNPRPEPIKSPFEELGADGEPVRKTPQGKRIATAAETLAILSRALG